MFSTNSMAMLTDLLFSPVFHRHPNLKIGLSEGGVGWIPYVLERAGLVWERRRYYQNVDQTTPPSGLFRRNVRGCLISDEHGVKNRPSDARSRTGVIAAKPIHSVTMMACSGQASAPLRAAFSWSAATSRMLIAQ
jgi:hypothetical protein